MKTNTYRIKNGMIITLMFLALVSCKKEVKSTKIEEAGTNEVSLSSTSKKDSEEKKIIKGVVEVTFDGQTVSFSDFDQNMSTDVVYLDNGI